jgi:hypothetical protein
VTLAAKANGTISCRITGGGTHLGVPALPVSDMPVTAQLVNGDGTCWSAAFDRARKNTARLLQASSN